MMLRFAIPSKGSGYDHTTRLLESCGLRISRPSPRNYVATLRGLSDVEILLHRPEDIVEKVAQGNIDLGITGMDILHEQRADDDNVLIVYEDLGFWSVELVFAVPQSWIDVVSWEDLADLSVEMQQQGKHLCIATKFPNLVRQFCYSHGINAFRLIPSAGATEAAPGLGYADIIADIMETGSALRENYLKVVDGSMLTSQACLIGSKRALKNNSDHLEQVRQLLELIEARDRGRASYSLVANIAAPSMEAIGRLITQMPHLAGLQGPTISPVWNKHETITDTEQQWFAINVVVPQKELQGAVDYLRSIGASTVTATPVQYTFYEQSTSYQRLREMLEE